MTILRNIPDRMAEGSNRQLEPVIPMMEWRAGLRLFLGWCGPYSIGLNLLTCLFTLW
jgi:hypothetical protein